MKTIDADLLLKELNRRSEEINNVIDYADVAEFELERIRKFISSNVSKSFTEKEMDDAYDKGFADGCEHARPVY